MSLADEYDVTFYHRDATIYVATRTGACERLLSLLDALGLDRHHERGEVWHQVPPKMDEIALKAMADRAVPLLAQAGYQVDIDAGLFGGTAYRAALGAHAAPRPPTPTTPPARPHRPR
ncbi:hypothetical protein AB0D60_19255 [Streptomyces sp. NPDC048306]|uniref:hypothetical protein n=1 Tax=Streptomyces sp. NPDC048306 TaxID=3154502 RepID=UPI0033E602A4